MVANRCRERGGDDALIRGLGIDVVAIERVRAVLARHGERFCARVLTADEQAYCRAQHDPATRVAARWAAKEAALKALGTGLANGMSLPDIEVLSADSGAPSLRFHGAAATRLNELGATTAWLSITHDHGCAAAVVVLEG